ncbi:hypothetical protein PMZ80_003052 [Knufia obscura]|uniref:Uncharacterized protein n=2 Tax=Knufia TaxID=430999 RepID=A0AAN8EEL5_9EURO|nr:hypothetical protein PMZ80_003052 [Knufia obscura]KAK5952360.1 hypothetical protein OHC33_006403 [Knufia fluminis]
MACSAQGRCLTHSLEVLRGSQPNAHVEPPSSDTESDDGFSIISDSEVIYTPPLTATSRSSSPIAQQPDLTQELARMTKLNATLQTELNSAKAERDEAQQTIESQDLAKKAEEHALLEELDTLRKGPSDVIPDIPTLVEKYKEEKAENIKSQKYINALTDGLRKEHNKVRKLTLQVSNLKQDKKELEDKVTSHEKELAALKEENVSTQKRAETDVQLAALLRPMAMRREAENVVLKQEKVDME